MVKKTKVSYFLYAHGIVGTVDSEEIKPYRLLFALYTKRMTSKKKKVDNNIILGVKILFSFPLINKMIKTK